MIIEEIMGDMLRFIYIIALRPATKCGGFLSSKVSLDIVAREYTFHLSDITLNAMHMTREQAVVAQHCVSPRCQYYLYAL